MIYLFISFVLSNFFMVGIVFSFGDRDMEYFFWNLEIKCLVWEIDK